MLEHIQFEITTICNSKCRYCYNFWKTGIEHNDISISKKQMGYLLSEMKKVNIKRIIFTGGEPLLNYKVMLFGTKKAVSMGMGTSCNTNATLLTKEKAKALKEAGLHHMLISLNSFNDKTNDYMTSRKSFLATKKGIINAVDVGIKVSINMMIYRKNIKDIFETAKLVQKLGASKFHATRLLPPNYDIRKEFELSEVETRYMLDELVRVKKKLGIDVGNLISCPRCFMKDKKYDDIYQYGCTAGDTKIAISPNGNARACEKNDISYGNVYDIGIKKCWDNMKKWRDGSYTPIICKKCSILNTCQTGCRLFGKFDTGLVDGPENLCKGW